MPRRPTRKKRKILLPLILVAILFGGYTGSSVVSSYMSTPTSVNYENDNQEFSSESFINQFLDLKSALYIGVSFLIIVGFMLWCCVANDVDGTHRPPEKGHEELLVPRIEVR